MKLKIALIFTVFIIFFCKNISAQVSDPRFDKFVAVNEWTGTISVKVNWTQGRSGTAVINGTVSMLKSGTGGLNLMWGFDAMHPWMRNWDVVYSTSYTDGDCSYSRSGEHSKFSAALYINPLNYTYSLAFNDPPIPVDYTCPDDEKGITNTDVVYGLEVRHLKLNLDELLIKGTANFTDIEAQQKDKEVFDSYKDTMVNTIDRNREILDAYGVPVPSVEGPGNNTPDESNGIRYEVAWELHPNVNSTQITLKEVDESWLPTDDNSISTYAEWNPNAKAVAIRFTLFEITNEPGYCLNSQEKHTDMDIVFDSAWATENHYEFSNEEGVPNKIIATRRSISLNGREEVRIKSLDFGGWAKLKVELMVNGVWVPSDNLPYVTVPFDKDEDKITDKWESEYNVSGLDPASDEDAEPRKMESGDAITLYEEYRGFYVLDPDKKHIRMDPVQKELFVIDTYELFSPASWKTASGITAYRLDNSMVQGGPDKRESRIVDFNQQYSPGHHKYSVRLVRNNQIRFLGSESVYLGIAKGSHGAGTGSPPKYWDSTIIFVNAIITVVDRYLRSLENLRTVTDDSLTASTTLTREEFNRLYELMKNPGVADMIKEFYRNYTILHEVGHSCGLDDHPPGYDVEHSCPMKYFDISSLFIFTKFYLRDIMELLNNSGEGETIVSYANCIFCDFHLCNIVMNVKDD